MPQKTTIFTDDVVDLICDAIARGIPQDAIMTRIKYPSKPESFKVGCSTRGISLRRARKATPEDVAAFLLGHTMPAPANVQREPLADAKTFIVPSDDVVQPRPPSQKKPLIRNSDIPSRSGFAKPAPLVDVSISIDRQTADDMAQRASVRGCSWPAYMALLLQKIAFNNLHDDVLSSG